MNRILRKTLIGMGLAGLMYAGKAEAQEGSLRNCTPPEYATITDAQRVLGMRNIGLIDMNLPEGYKTHKGIGTGLRLLAGLYNGTIEAIKDGEGRIYFEGNYSQFEDPESLVRVLQEADVNCDKIIIREEEMDQLRRQIK